MTKEQYRREHEKVARKARAEFREHVNTEKLPKVFDRAIDYLVKNMGFSTVMDQQPNWILGHIVAFARKEVRRADRKAK